MDRSRELKVKVLVLVKFRILFNFRVFLGILEKLLSQENRVLEVWTARKKRLDQCQQFSLFIYSVRQVLEWLSTTGEGHLMSHPIREIKILGKDVALQWLEANKKFREEAKVSVSLGNLVMD